MKIDRFGGALLLATLFSGCPTRTVYFPDAGSGGISGGGAGGAAGDGLSGKGGETAAGGTGTAGGGTIGGRAGGAGGAQAAGGGGGSAGIGGAAGRSGMATGGNGGAAGAGAAGRAAGGGGAAGQVTGTAGAGGASAGTDGGSGGCPGTIDFEDLATMQTFKAVSLPYVQGGFSLTTDDPDGLYSVGTKAVQYLDTAAVDANYNAVVTLSRTDRKPFALLAIDLSPYNLGHSGIVYSFVGHKTDGATISADISLQTTKMGFLPYSLPPSFDNLLSVSWTLKDMADNAQYFDNIRYSFCPGG